MSRLHAHRVTASLGKRRVVSDVDLCLQGGSLLGLLGPNGAGKSTALRMLAGLLSPDAGRVTLNDQDLRTIPAGQRASQIAYLPQSKECHWPLNVQALVTLGRLPHRDAWRSISDSDQKAIRQAMRDADILQFAGRTVNELSGGERARVLLARALSVQAPVLLADEPVAGLDPAHQLRVISLLKSQAEQGKAVVVVLHDLSLAARFCDQVVLMDQGRVHASGDTDAVMTDANLRAVFGIEVYRGQYRNRPILLPV